MQHDKWMVYGSDLRIFLLAMLYFISGCSGGTGEIDLGTIQVQGNYLDAGEYTVGYTESVLQVAQEAADIIELVIIQSGTVISSNCSNNGNIYVSFTDTDQDKQVTKGDSITVSYTDCYRSSINESLSGDIAIVIGEPSDGFVYGMNVSFSDLVLNSSPLDVVTISGSLNIDYINDGKNHSLSISPGGVNFTVKIVSKEFSIHEEFKSFRIIKAINIETSRYELFTEGEIHSPIFDAPLIFSTQSNFAGTAGSSPESLMISYSVNESISGSVTSNSNNAIISKLDKEGKILSQENVFWLAFIEGFIWTNPVAVSDYPVTYLDVNEFHFTNKSEFSLNSPKIIKVNDSLILQFSRDVSSVSVDSVLFLPSDNSGASFEKSIPASIEILGNKVVLTPLIQLQHDIRYTLEWFNVLDQFSNLIYVQQVYVKTPDTLSALITSNRGFVGNSGESLLVDGSSSISNGVSIVSYGWSEVTTFGALFSQPSEMQTQVTLPSVEKQEVILIQLEVENSLGEKAQQVIELNVIPLLVGSTYIYYSGEEGEFISEGKTGFVGGSNSSISRFNRGLGKGVGVRQFGGQFWSLEILAPNDGFLEGKIYLDAIGIYQFGDSNRDNPILRFERLSRRCDAYSGKFEVIELSFGVFDSVDTLAVDVEQQCNNEGPKLHGVIRINSRVPLNR